MKSVKKPSVVPVYAVAAVWLAYSCIFGLHSIFQCLLCAGISAAVYLLLKSRFPGRTVQVEERQKAPDTGDKQLDQLILQGRESVKSIRRLNGKIPDAPVTATLNDIESVASRILAQLEADKSQYRRCRQFLDYYLPTTVKLLERYVKLQSQGQRDGNINQAMGQIEAMLKKIRAAFRRQLDSMFENDMVDISADIAVMEQMMRANGLAGQEEL